MIDSSTKSQLNAVYSRPGMRRRYEVWFVRCGLADGSGAWWFRYLLVQQPKPTAANRDRRYFQVWATWFPSGGAPESFIVDVPIQELQLSELGRAPFHCRVSECGFEEGRCWGRLRPQGHDVRWNLRIYSHFGVKLSDKGWIGFSRSPHSDAVFSGEIVFDGKKFSGELLGFGVQGHNCGYRHRSFWRWMHAYFPQPGGGSTLEALVYDLPLGFTFRNAIWWHQGRGSRIRQIRELEVVRSAHEVRWRFSGALDNGLSIEALIGAAAPGIHELPYAKTDGSGTFPVSNASLAHALVQLGSGESLETRTGAVLEMGGAGPP
ncbi:MAG TPA: hypothetical protein VL128_11935 [Candidatus Eisenbacteria bacterium]|nr:hypothetical protein [Candidatus Eisenbacteria bacterium]